MNELKGKIIRVESSQSVSLIEVNVEGDTFVSVLLETPQSAVHLKAGQEVALFFKETEVAIAKNLSGMVSLSNRFKSQVKKMETSKILSKLWLDYKGTQVVSIISTRSAARLGLKEGDAVEWLVKANEVSVSFLA